MDYLALGNLLNTPHIQLPGQAFTSILANDKNQFIFLKNQLSVYQYANESFTRLMGLKKERDIYNKTDALLSRDKKKIKIYQQDDESVLDTGEPLSICAQVLPRFNESLSKELSGTLHPIFNDTAKIIGVMGIVRLQYSLYNLSLETAVCLSDEELNKVLSKRTYPVKAFGRKIFVSKREIQCLIGLIKGRHAGEIARALSLKQSTVEFYLENIKNKLGALSKSNLIHIVFDQQIIQQVIL